MINAFLLRDGALSYKTFFQWLMISLYQGAGIMIMSLVLFESEFFAYCVDFVYGVDFE